MQEADKEMSASFKQKLQEKIDRAIDSETMKNLFILYKQRSGKKNASMTLGKYHLNFFRTP